MSMRRWNVVATVTISALVLWSSGVVAKGDAIVTPSGIGDGLGNSNNIEPFNPWSPSRMQQVYAASDFASMSGPQYIDAIAFRSNQFGATLQDITITMSTTSKAVDGLSPVFANNTGSDVQTVYQGTLPIFSTESLNSATPPPFGLVINLQHPFLYDPSKGNLLVDITNPSPSQTVFVNTQTPTLDAQDVLGDSTSRVLGYIGPLSPSNPYAVSDLSHGNPDTLGLVTEFLTGGPDPIPQPPIPAVIPEPSSLLVMSMAAAGMLISARSRRWVRQGEP